VTLDLPESFTVRLPADVDVTRSYGYYRQARGPGPLI
jgi:hypothetical protein